MPNSGSGGAATTTPAAWAATLGAALFVAFMTWDVLSGAWDAVVENKGPIVLVALGLAVVLFAGGDANNTPPPPPSAPPHRRAWPHGRSSSSSHERDRGPVTPEPQGRPSGGSSGAGR